MRIRERMIKNVATCRPGNNLAEVAAIMWMERCGALPVVDEQGHVVSIITDRDVCIALGTRNLLASEVLVQDVVPPRVFTCLDRDELSHALSIMVAQNVRRLPVVTDEGILVGILSIDDFLLHTEPGKAGVLSLEALEAVKTIVENRQRGHVHEPAEVVPAKSVGHS